MTNRSVDQENITADRLIDTLFGVVEKQNRTSYHRSVADEELPHFLFEDRKNDLQTSLPLIEVKRYRSKTISCKKIKNLIPYLDELQLFEHRWGFEKKTADREDWCHWTEAQAVPILNKMIGLCQQQQLLDPRAVYAYFFCAAENETLFLYKEDQKDVFLTIDFPRLKNGVCVIDKIARKSSATFDTIAAVAVNMGRNATEMAKRWLSVGKDVDYRYLHGFALEMLNAMIQYTASVIAAEECCLGNIHGLGSAKEGSAKIQSALIKMLDASLIDIAFSRNYLMMPEYSSLALVFPR